MNLRILFFLFLLIASIGCGKRQSADEKYRDLLSKAEKFQKEEKWDEARIVLSNAVDTKPEEAEGYYKLAEVMVHLKAFGRALELYQSAINHNPAHRDARLHLAAFLLAANKPEEAEGHIRKLLETNANDNDVLILQAGLHTMRKDHINARKVLDQVLAADAKNPTALAALGDVSLAEGKGDEAENLFKKSLEVKPENPPVRLVLADLYMRQGRLDESQKILQNLVDTNPANAGLRFFLGEFLLLRGMNDQALEQYQKTITFDASRHDARDRMYDFKLIKKDYDGAKQLTAELKKSNEKDPALLYFQGRDAEVDGRMDEALKFYLRGLEGMPNFAPAFRRAGTLELQSGKTGEGVEHLNQAVAINSNDVGARLALARHYFLRRDLPQAKDHVTRILQFFPRQIGANILRADIALVEGDTKNAEHVYKQLVDLLPNNPTGYLKLAVLNEQKKDFPAAMDSYRKVLTFDQEILLPAGRLADLLISKDGVDKAIEEFTALRERSQSNKAEYSLILSSLRLRKPGERAAVLAESRKLVEESLELNPNLLPSYFALAQIDALSGDSAGAIKNYEKLVEKKPTHIPSRMLLAMNLERAKRFSDAATQYQAILKLMPRFGPAANNLAWLQAVELKGDLEDALRLAQIAKEELPSHSQATDTLGWIYYLRSSSRAALPYLEEAVELEAKNNPARPDGKRNINPEILYHLGVVQNDVGDKDGARKSLQEAIDLAGPQHPMRGEFSAALAKVGE